MFEFLKNSSNFQVLYQKKQLFRETNESKSANSKTEIVDALEQNTSAIFPAVENNQSPSSGFFGN